MNQLRLSLLSLLLLLAACSRGVDPVAEEALTKMHDTMMKHLMTYAITVDQPLIAQTLSTLNVKIFPAAKSYKGNASLKLQTTMKSDVTDAKNPIADLLITLTGSADVPPATTDTPSAKPERISLNTVINGRAVDRTLSLNFAKTDVTAAAFLPTPFTLPEAMTARWYGKTFAEIDAILKDKPSDEKQPPIDEILSNALRGIRMTPEQLKKLGNDTHLWKGMEMLPEKNGQLQIRVESDKKKIRNTVRALLTFVEEVSGPSWESQMRTNGELKTMMESLTKNDAEFLRTMGSMEGVISADKETYDFMGFDGDIFDEKGSLSGRISIARMPHRGFTAALTDTATNETLTLTRTGDSLTVTSGTNVVMQGTVNSKRVDLVASDPKTNVVVGSVELDITALSLQHFEIDRGVITLPRDNVVITIDTLSVTFSDSFKNVVMSFKTAGTLGDKPFFTTDFTGSRSEIPAFTLEKPSFLPLEDLQQDFMDAFMPPIPGEQE